MKTYDLYIGLYKCIICNLAFEYLKSSDEVNIIFHYDWLGVCLLVIADDGSSL